MEGEERCVWWRESWLSRFLPWCYCHDWLGNENSCLPSFLSWLFLTELVDCFNMSTETLSSRCETSCQRFATQEFIRPWRTVQKVSFALSHLLSTCGYADVMHAAISSTCGFSTLRFHKAFSHWRWFFKVFLTSRLWSVKFSKDTLPFQA